MENNNNIEEVKIKKSNSKYVMKWQVKNLEKMKIYRERENILRREKRRLMKILL